jgi:hypothetical protein
VNRSLITRVVLLVLLWGKGGVAAAPVDLPGDDAELEQDLDEDLDEDAQADATAPVAEPTAPATSAEETKTPTFVLGGYLQPQLGASYRADAVPRDRWRYGAESTQAGLEVSGEPIARWSYALAVVVSGEEFDLVSDFSIVDEIGAGAPDDVVASHRRVTGLFVEQATVTFNPASWVALTLGQMRVPFTVQEQSPATALMFPSRSGPNEVFVQGPDLGFLAGFTFGHIARAQVGAFNGTGAAAGVTSERGLVYAARVDVHPLGPLPRGEGDTQRGPLRFGMGAGVLYYPTRIYDDAGFPGSRIRDLRISGAVRAAVRGAFLQTEFFRRQRTDSLSSRPEITTGAYVQASMYLPLALPVGIAPIARFGWASEDQGFAPRTTRWIEAGLTVFPDPTRPEVLRVTLQYLGEKRLTEGESAHGGVLQVQYTW